MNLRYFIEGPPAAIAFFVGIYDVFDRLRWGCCRPRHFLDAFARRAETSPAALTG